MRLKIGTTLENNTVKLDCSSGNAGFGTEKFQYKIDSNKADEFVHLYNTASQKLEKATLITTITGAILGVLPSIKSQKSKVIKAAGGTLSGAGIGFLTATLISYNIKNNLMNKYNVLKY